VKNRISFKAIFVLVLFAGIMAFAFSGCTTNEPATPATVQTPQATTPTPAPTPATTDAVVADDLPPLGTPGNPFDPPIEVTWLLRGNLDDPTMVDQRGERSFKYLQDQIGVHVTLQMIEGNSEDQLLLMLAAGQFPHVISWPLDAAYPGGIAAMAADGIVRQATHLVNNYMPNFRAHLDAFPHIEAQLTNASWDHYSFSIINTHETAVDRAIVADHGLVIRNDWLENVGMDVPTNIEEWREVLRAFAIHDPNGDGLQNEIPWDGRAIDHFAAAFGVATRYFVRPGTGEVAFGPLEPGFREWLEEMNLWYREGLIGDNSITPNNSLTDSNIVAGLSGSWLALTNNWERFIDDMRQADPGADFIPVPWPLTPDGHRFTPRNELARHDHRYRTVITTNASDEQAIAIARLLDMMYSDEGSFIMGWGIEGVSWEMVNGEPSRINFEPGVEPPRHFYVRPHAAATPRWGHMLPWYENFNPLRMIAARVWGAADVSSELVFPPFIQFNAEETAVIQGINSEMGTFLQDMTNRFITGEESFGNYDAFVEQVRRFGVEDAIEIYQRNLDAFNSKLNR
jgi:putative aldouronate transport system substrate-binding protein